MASARHRAQIDRMSRWRRLFLYDRYFFVSVNLVSCCSAGPALRPCGFSSGTGSFPAAVALPFRSAPDEIAQMPTPQGGVGATLAANWSATQEPKQPNQDQVKAYDISEELGENQNQDACGQRNNRRERSVAQREGTAPGLRESRGGQQAE